MSKILGAYWAPGHNRESDLAYIAALDAFAHRVFGGNGPDVMQVSRAYQSAPKALFALRNWELDDDNFQQQERMQANPAAFALANANAQIAMVERLERQAQERGLPFPPRRQILLNGLNEPTIWGAEQAQRRANLDIYSVTFGARIEASGCGVMVGCINPGHPAEWPPTWDWFAQTLAWLERSERSYLELHEYWQPEGPSCVWTDESGNQRHDAGALAWRHRHLNANVRIIIGECGVDGVLHNRHASRNTGWQAYINAEQFASQLVEYANGCDERVKAISPFRTDYDANNEDGESSPWATFDTAPAHGAILARVGEIRQSNPSGNSNSSTVHLPIVSNGGGSVTLPQGVIDPLVLEAILQIESNGRALADDGRPIIRFEAHIFKQQLGNDALFAKHFAFGGEGYKIWQNRRMNNGSGWKSIESGGQPVQWEAFDLAASLGYEAAAQSISMGAPQIMGFNHASIGYPSATQMLEAFGDANVQVIAFINFILGCSSLQSAVRNKDWREIARIYNGVKNVDYYAPKLEGAYNNLAGRA